MVLQNLCTLELAVRPDCIGCRTWSRINDERPSNGIHMRRVTVSVEQMTRTSTFSTRCTPTREAQQPTGPRLKPTTLTQSRLGVTHQGVVRCTSDVLDKKACLKPIDETSSCCPYGSHNSALCSTSPCHSEPNVQVTRGAEKRSLSTILGGLGLSNRRLWKIQTWVEAITLLLDSCMAPRGPVVSAD